MPKHDFGIMWDDPYKNEYYDKYEPKKYHCIQIDHSLIEPILDDTIIMYCYWQSLQRAEKGLDYIGITLIPPESLDAFIQVLLLQDNEDYEPLLSLIRQAKESEKFIIHFGI